MFNTGMLGICIKDLEMRVKYQNESSEKICGMMKGEVCTKACQTLRSEIPGCSAFSQGMKMFKNVDVNGYKADIVLVEDTQAITTMVYPLHSSEELLQQQEAYLRERGLTKSEVRIMQMVLQGMTNAVIAEKLFISKATLKTHLNNIYKKLPASMRPSQSRGG